MPVLKTEKKPLKDVNTAVKDVQAAVKEVSSNVSDQVNDTTKKRYGFRNGRNS